MLDRQKELQDLLHRAEYGLVLALVPDLLGDMREAERQVRPRPGEAAQLLRA
jgi:hypothetical protein